MTTRSVGWIRTDYHKLLLDSVPVAFHAEVGVTVCTIPIKRVLQITSDGILVLFDPYCFKDPKSDAAKQAVWFRRDSLRQYDGDLCFPADLAARKGLNI